MGSLDFYNHYNDCLIDHAVGIADLLKVGASVSRGQPLLTIHANEQEKYDEKALKEQGYSIARRTVAKYREQLNIPVARMRKEL